MSELAAAMLLSFCCVTHFNVRNIFRRRSADIVSYVQVCKGKLILSGQAQGTRHFVVAGL